MSFLASSTTSGEATPPTYPSHISVTMPPAVNALPTPLGLRLPNTALTAVSTTSTTLIRNSGHLDKPYGYDSLVDHGITPANITKASAQAYRAKGIITGTPALGAYDDVASQQVVANIGDGNGRQLLGGLPGEWTLPVCAQGTNYWTWNYESGTLGSGSNARGNSMLPCACGPQGSETAAFLAAANFNYQNTYMQESALADGCTDILANRPLGRGNVIHNSNSPGWDGIAGGHPTTLDLGDGTTIPYGRVCTQTQAVRKCTGP